MVTLCITCIALHCDGKPKAESPVVRKAEGKKSYHAKPEKSSCAQNADGGKVLLCGKLKARYDLAVLKSRRQPRESPVA